jgi:hypothetical protein
LFLKEKLVHLRKNDIIIDKKIQYIHPNGKDLKIILALYCSGYAEV